VTTTEDEVGTREFEHREDASSPLRINSLAETEEGGVLYSFVVGDLGGGRGREEGQGGRRREGGREGDGGEGREKGYVLVVM